MTDVDAGGLPDDDMDEFDDGQDDLADDMAGNRVTAGVSRSVLQYVTEAIVDEPEAVVIETDEGRNGVTLRVHVAPDDMGKVIGRRGRVAQAIRTVIRAAGARDGTEVHVDIVD